MADANDSRSSDSSGPLTPPQFSLPLSSSPSSLPTASSTTTPHIPQLTIPNSILRAPVPFTMNKDSCYTYVHMHKSSHADLFEDFCKDKLPKDDILVPPQLQPINPEEEDDVVPDQHAAYGVQKATQKTREPAWKDLGLAELMARGPGVGQASRGGRVRRGNGGGGGSKGLPR